MEAWQPFGQMDYDLNNPTYEHEGWSQAFVFINNVSINISVYAHAHKYTCPIIVFREILDQSRNSIFYFKHIARLPSRKTVPIYTSSNYVVTTWHTLVICSYFYLIVKTSFISISISLIFYEVEHFLKIILPIYMFFMSCSFMFFVHFPIGLFVFWFFLLT